MAKKTRQHVACGIIMPISPTVYNSVPYSAEYWRSMLAFLKDAIDAAGFDPQPVWENDAESAITPRIVKNIQEIPLAVCVISTLNSNVMMELGMRLFADKPVLVIYDESIVRLPFDINDLEALSVPSCPLYEQLDGIKKQIADHLNRMNVSNYTTYLSRFKMQAPNSVRVEVTEQSEVQRLKSRVDQMSRDIEGLRNQVQQPSFRGPVLGSGVSQLSSVAPVGPTGSDYALQA